MKDLYPASRVETALGKQNEQDLIRTLDDVPARYRDYPGFDSLTIDPAHGAKPEPKTIREAMSAVEAELSGAIKGPVSRPDSTHIDFYDGDGNPFDVKTPLSPKYQDKWEFDYVKNAHAVLDQLGMHHKNKLTGEVQQVAVLLDTTYMTPEDHQNMWRQMRAETKEDRSVLKRVFEVNVRLPEKKNEKAKMNGSVMNALLQKRGR